MLKLFKYLKTYSLHILLIIGLLFIQATTDLSLPDYMSNIVNVGIQQGGISDAALEVIRESEYEKLSFLLTEEENQLFTDYYVLLDKRNLSEKDYENYIKKYPLLEQESLYHLNTKDKGILEKINQALSKKLLILYGINQADSSPQDATQFFEMPNIANIPEGMDLFTVLKNLPEEQIVTIFDEINKKLESMPQSMITQSAILYVKDEYQAIGMDLSKIQNHYLFNTGGMMILVALLSMVATVLVGFLGARVAAGLGKILRERVFKKVTTFSNTEFDDFSTASLITRSTNDIQQVQTLMVMLLRVVFYAPILGIGGVMKALRTNTSMAWIIAVGVMAILTLVIVLFSVAMPRFKKVQKLVDKVNLVIRESLVGMLVIRAFNTEKHEENKFDQANKDLTNTNLFISRMMSTMMPLMMLIMNGVTLLIVWVGAKQVDLGTIQVGDMMAFMQYTMQIIMSFLMISMVSIMLPRASVSASRIIEVIDKDVAIQNPTHPKPFQKKARGLVEFKNVSFQYPGANDYVLDNISFTAMPGETTAFIGSTGSGKSTLINLIPRFYDATKGEILIDGMNIKNVTLEDLRSKIGYVPQKGILFSGTIESNIKYGDIDIPDEIMNKASQIAQAESFIKEKEDGYQSNIAQGGNNVSGGQKQRLSIARALAKQPEIFIFDDSFSALDYKTDVTLRKALKDEIKDSTILIVAQRISTILDAEKIIVLDQGKIVGEGTHKELLANCQVYKEIAESQLSKEELAS